VYWANPVSNRLLHSHVFIQLDVEENDSPMRTIMRPRNGIKRRTRELSGAFTEAAPRELRIT
jgi:hypothetical protein